VFFFSGFEKNLICIYFFQSNSYTEQYNNKYQLTTTMPRTKASKAETDSAAIDKKLKKNGEAKAPRKPRSPTAYNFFVKKFYEDYKASEDNEKLAPKEMISAAASAWKALSEDDKATFIRENMPVKEDKADKSDTEPDKTAADDKPKKSSKSKDKTQSDNTDSAEKQDSKPKKDRKSKKDSLVEVVAKIADSDGDEATPAATEPVKKEKSSRKSKKSDKSSDNE